MTRTANLTTSKTIQPISCGVSQIGQNRDCTVRALANTGTVSYKHAHALLKSNGRREGCGAVIKTFHSAYISAGLKLEGIFGTTVRAKLLSRHCGVAISKGTSLGKILPTLACGRYVVMVTGHALAVVNGQIIDKSALKSSMSVFAVYKV